MSTSFPLSRRSLVLSALCVLVPLNACVAAKQEPAVVPCFTDAEREAIRTYWNAPNRYVVAPSPDALPRVNVTVDGSTWYLAFTKVLNALKKSDPVTASIWQGWWEKRYTVLKAIATESPTIPPDPGPAPEALITAVGSPCPNLYEKVSPTRYTITFAPSDAANPFVYEDGIDFGKRSAYYGYYRSKNGVIRPGKRVKEATGDEKKRIEAIFAKAGRTDFERRVLQAVSQYEGGFEAINTYDTGFVSIGFIQFITALDGKGSLSEVLNRYKTDDPTGFQNDFRRFGIDVSPDMTLVCVDPAMGTEVRGVEAVRCVIDDKRLTATFERAAAYDGFRLAQVSVARSHYWPGEDSFPLPSGQATIRVGDVIRSEAGMATLMDKKVNRGNIRDFADVAARIMAEQGLTDPRDLAKYEHSLIAAMKYRGDFLADSSLSQPAPDPTPMPSPTPTPSPKASAVTMPPTPTAPNPAPTAPNPTPVPPRHRRR